MPNWCDCKLTITGPNRQAVLNKIKGDEVYVVEDTDINGNPYREEHVVHFDVEKIIPRPKEVAESEGWADWGYENWGCRNVYPDRQHHAATGDADVIYFYAPWNPPLYAIDALSVMFPDNTFLLEDWESDLPYGTTLFRAGRSSLYVEIPNVNRDTGKTATLFEIFQSVLRRGGSVQEAPTEVAKVKAKRLAAAASESGASDGDADLNAEVEAIVAPYLYDVTMIPADEERIAELLANKDELDALLAMGVECQKLRRNEPITSSEFEVTDYISAKSIEAETAVNELSNSNT
jgi:hypothetical protein